MRKKSSEGEEGEEEGVGTEAEEVNGEEEDGGEEGVLLLGEERDCLELVLVFFCFGLVSFSLFGMIQQEKKRRKNKINKNKKEPNKMIFLDKQFQFDIK